jgi:hypothetical protein
VTDASKPNKSKMFGYNLKLKTATLSRWPPRQAVKREKTYVSGTILVLVAHDEKVLLI